MDLGDRKKYQSKNVVPTSLFDFCIYCRSFLDSLATIHNAADRQTDSAIGISRLCYSIGGLKFRLCITPSSFCHKSCCSWFSLQPTSTWDSKLKIYHLVALDTFHIFVGNGVTSYFLSPENCYNMLIFARFNARCLHNHRTCFGCVGNFNKVITTIVIRPLDDSTWCVQSRAPLDWAHRVGSSSGLITIVVMTLLKLGWSGWAHSVARPCIRISSPLTHKVYLWLFLSYLAGSQSVSTRPPSIRPYDPDTMTNSALPSGKNLVLWHTEVIHPLCPNSLKRWMGFIILYCSDQQTNRCFTALH